jgi:hypothetical protein
MSLLPPSRSLRLAFVALLLTALVVRVLLGLPKLNSLRYWDERYGAENLVALLEHGQLRPANGFHPTLSYFPQAIPLAVLEGLHAATGIAAFDAVAETDLTPTGYLTCRLTQALLGVLSLWVFYLVARRLHDEPTALVGVLLLAAVPWHVRQSAIYKPDILLLLTTLLAIHLALVAIERPTLRRYLWAGFGVGVAMASKFNAGPAAIPLTVGAALAGWRDRRQWVWLVLAGATAAATLLFFDPWLLTAPELYRADFGRTLRDYASKAARAGTSSPWHVFVEGVESLLGPSFHGPLLGVLGFLGLALLLPVAVRRLRRGHPASPPDAVASATPPTPASGLVMWLSFPLVYSLAYCLATRNPSPHNWLPISPMLSLAGAWLLVATWRRVARSLPLLARPAAAWTAGLLLAAGTTVPAVGFAYQEALPSTLESLAEELVPDLRPVRGRFVYYEPAPGARVLSAPAGVDGPEEAPTAGAGETSEAGAAADERLDADNFADEEGLAEGNAGFALDDLPAGPLAGSGAGSATDPLDPMTGALLDRSHRLVVRDWRGRAAVRPLRRLAERSAEALRFADVVVFPAARLETDDAAPYRELLAAADRRVDGSFRFARNHGPDFVAAFRRWEALGEPTPIAAWPLDLAEQGRRGPGVFELTLPPAGPGVEAVTLELAVRKLRQLPRLRDVRLDGATLDTVWVGRGGGPSTFFTTRFAAAPLPRTIRLELDGDPPAEAGARLSAVSWRHAAAGGTP